MSAVAPQLVETRYRLTNGSRDLGIAAGDELVIGRAADCDLVLHGGLISRHHARLSAGPAGFLIDDLGSRNGVLVNQQKLKGTGVLCHGDVVSIGLESFDVVDDHLMNHAPNLSTLPPSSGAFSESDVVDYEQDTVIARLDVLSPREREVLKLLVLGHTQKAAAERLYISVKTVETHRARIADKLGCRTRAELVSYAVTAGLLRGPLTLPTIV
jgi:DNA-binding NarL/FixJ family response regulator